MEQRGKDNEGILGFLSLDIQKELRRGKKLVNNYIVTCKRIEKRISFCNFFVVKLL